MTDLQACVLLRGSTLTPEEKKRVILESDNSLEVLGASFFQEMTGQKSNSKQKVYSADTLTAEHEDQEGQTFLTQDDLGEDEFVEAMLSEGDSDAALVTDDSDLASAYSAYTEARKRLTEKFKNRGFWSTSKSSFSTSKGKGHAAKGVSKGKGQWYPRPKRSLQDRIFNSYCRNCNRKDQWKAECPYKQSGSSVAGVSSAPSTATGSMPTTTVSADDVQDVMPLEFLDLPTIGQETIDDTLPILVSYCDEWVRDKPSYESDIQGEFAGVTGIMSACLQPENGFKRGNLRGKSRSRSAQPPSISTESAS